MSKIAYQCDKEGYFVEEVFCQESPLEPGVWLCPAGATFEQAPHIPEGKRALYDSGRNEWELVDSPVVENPPVSQAETEFKKFTPAMKESLVQNQKKVLLYAMQTALERMQWRDLLNNPVDPELKLAWAMYRKELLMVPNETHDQTFFIKLQSLEDFPFPQIPEMPEEVV